MFKASTGFNGRFSATVHCKIHLVLQLNIPAETFILLKGVAGLTFIVSVQDLTCVDERVLIAPVR
jgi:hypothetical protein